jgi:hypothetical protein
METVRRASFLLSAALFGAAVGALRAWHRLRG